MDNIKDENLKRLGKYIAESLFDLSRSTDREDWIEENMLDQAFFVEDNSRLGCQLQLLDNMDGLIARLAPEAED